MVTVTAKHNGKTLALKPDVQAETVTQSSEAVVQSAVHELQQCFLCEYPWGASCFD